MKTRWIAGLFFASFVTLVAPMPSIADTDVSVGVQVNAVGDFYEPLGSHGYWVEVAPYGRCWYPRHVHTYWRPYCYGSWVWTDCGWYWVSDEPWAWACYHYGRWVWNTHYGWLWVPGTVWGPAWVSFRWSDSHVGWAPLTPDCDFGPSGVIVDVRIPPLYFVFVEHRRFCHRISPSVVVVDQKIVRKTVNVTKIKVVNKTVINEGPQTAEVERRSGDKVRVAKVSELRAAKASLQRRADQPARRAEEIQKPEEPRKIEEKKKPAETKSSEVAIPAPEGTVVEKPQPAVGPGDTPPDQRIGGRGVKKESPPERPKKFQKHPFRQMPPESSGPKSGDPNEGAGRDKNSRDPNR